MRIKGYDNKSHKIARRKLIRQKMARQVEWMVPDKDSAQSGSGTRNASNRKG